MHTCSYDLTLNQLNLGKITFYREHPFDGWELENIENHLATLVFPLRNAGKYEKLQELIDSNNPEGNIKHDELYQDSLIF